MSAYSKYSAIDDGDDGDSCESIGEQDPTDLYIILQCIGWQPFQLTSFTNPAELLVMCHT